MTEPDPDEYARRLVAENPTDPTGWFERLYEAAERGEAVVPWSRGAPHPLLVEWAQARGLDGQGRRAMVVGFGRGDDAELVAGLGYDTVAFDVSGTAVRAARRRFPESKVDYRVADLLNLPSEWHHGFGLVVEVFTVQSLPIPAHRKAISSVVRMVAPGGTLIVVGFGREPDEPADGPPWPLTSSELEAFSAAGLLPVLIEDIRDPARPIARRWRAEFHRPMPD
jgi:ubiquinone/menaquinone biosynthesis C-methylase UbiE